MHDILESARVSMSMVGCVLDRMKAFHSLHSSCVASKAVSDERRWPRLSMHCSGEGHILSNTLSVSKMIYKLQDINCKICKIINCLMVPCSTVSTNSTCLAVRARWDFWPGRLQRQGTLSIPRPVAPESPMAAW